MSEPAAAAGRVFAADKRIKLGIWGLGRGMSFYRTCAALNIDVVAGCDYNEHMRQRFLEQQPEAFASADEDEFLAQDMDAVLVATYCTEHAPHVVKCLRAGKHALSEVTAFHTMAEGVELVEAVEAGDLVYNLAENVPFNRTNMYLADQWRKGLFGELMYAEFEYVHECRSLVYTFIDGVPVVPGNSVHYWRSWLNFHYYNTHSMGPVMTITGTRPTRVAALPGTQRLAGYLLDSPAGMGGICPSLMTMSNGGLMRNLMGATTNDSHIQRLWGTLGSAEVNNGLYLRLGGAGVATKLQVDPEWPTLGEHAERTGHGGGDFWTLYYFARQILTGEPALFDVYAACDCTIPGILAYRSSIESGKAFDVPDFRCPEARAKHRDDDFAQPRYDVAKGCFPPDADAEATGRFSTIMKDLIRGAVTVRAYMDWEKVFDEVREKDKVVALADAVLDEADTIAATMASARTLADSYPASDGAKALREILELGCEEEVRGSNFVAALRQRRDEMRRQAGDQPPPE